MSKYKWGKSSLRRMEGVNPLLIQCATRALSKMVNYDMTIPWMGGKRTEQEQNDIFRNGNSQLDGFKKKSYHQTGNALDVVPWHNGKIDYDCHRGFAEFMAAMFDSWEELEQEGETANYKLEWGGHWKSFVDKPHWQLVGTF